MVKLVLLPLLIVASSFISDLEAQCNIGVARSRLPRAIYEFSTELTKRIAQDTDNHFVVSPLSLWVLIAAMSEGAAYQTLEEIIEVLHLHHQKCFNHKYYEIVRGASQSDDEVTIERSGLLVFDESFAIQDNFKRAVVKHGIGDVMSLPFTNSNITAATINDYVSRATHNIITEIVSPDDLATTYVLLLDSIYFKGMWDSAFSSAETKLSAFYDEQYDKQIGNVNLMFKSDQFKCAPIDLLKSKVLELPYGSSGRHSMLIILPHRGETVADVTEKLQSVSLKAIFELLNKRGPLKTNVNLPRFKISAQLDNLKDLLIDMGLITMFDESAAEFTHIANLQLYVSDLIQKAEIEVTEEGTVAVAASAVLFGFRMMQSAPEEFNANKPFIFMIVDKLTNVMLFNGAYSKPSVY